MKSFFRYFVFALLLVTSPLTVGASVPTDYGNSAMQRTAFDTVGKYLLWCTNSDSSKATSTIAQDVNGYYYYEYNNGSSTADYRIEYNAPNNTDCLSPSNSYTVPPSQSWIRDQSNGITNFYVITEDSLFPSATSTFGYLTYGSRTASWTEIDGNNNDYPWNGTTNTTGTTSRKQFTVGATSYNLYKIQGLELDDFSQQSGFLNHISTQNTNADGIKIYAVIYSAEDYFMMSSASDFQQFMDSLFSVTNGGGSINPLSYATNTITRINEPVNGTVYSLGVATTTNVTTSFNYVVGDATYSYAYVELSNLTTGFAYVAPQHNILASGESVYTVTFTLPAGNYIWRPVLADSTYTNKKYHSGGAYRTFTIAGNTSEWWGSYTVSTTTASTSWNVAETIFGTSTYQLGTTTYDFSSVNLDFIDFGEGVCGVNMSCAIKICIDYRNLCNRFPFAYAADFYSIISMWNGVLSTGAGINNITYDLDLGVSSSTIVLMDLSEGSLARQLAERTHYWSSLLIWLVFGFWTWSFAGRFLT